MISAAPPSDARSLKPTSVISAADLKGYLAGLSVGEPESYAGLTLYPLTAAKDVSLARLLTLDEALKSKALVVTELEGGAEVNTLMLENTSARPIFLMSGEIMRGAKQDRTMQNDQLIPPHSGKLRVSVFCTEHGRWTETSSSFQASDQAVPNSVRQAAKVAKEQGSVWSSIDQNQRRLEASAPTSAAKDVYENKRVKRDLKPYLDHLAGLSARHAHTVGVVAAFGGRLVAVDAFGDDGLFARLYPKLLRSYAVDVLSDKPSGAFDAAALLKLAATGDWKPRVTEGFAHAFELDAKDHHGSALLDGATTVHMDLFEGTVPEPEPAPMHRPQMNRNPRQDNLRR
jgi:hypothetical protein